MNKPKPAALLLLPYRINMRGGCQEVPHQIVLWPCCEVYLLGESRLVQKVSQSWYPCAQIFHMDKAELLSKQVLRAAPAAPASRDTQQLEWRLHCFNFGVLSVCPTFIVFRLDRIRTFCPAIFFFDRLFVHTRQKQFLPPTRPFS